MFGLADFESKRLYACGREWRIQYAFLFWPFWMATLAETILRSTRLSLSLSATVCWNMMVWLALAVVRLSNRHIELQTLTRFWSSTPRPTPRHKHQTHTWNRAVRAVVRSSARAKKRRTHWLGQGFRCSFTPARTVIVLNTTMGIVRQLLYIMCDLSQQALWFLCAGWIDGSVCVLVVFCVFTILQVCLHFESDMHNNNVPMFWWLFRVEVLRVLLLRLLLTA